MPASDSRDDSFEIESNSPFYFNTSHWRAVDGMLEGVRDRAGMMLLTGPTGSGKTMIMRAISEGLEENTPGLFLQYASLNFREFINFLHTSLRVEDEIMDAANKAVALREFLYVQAKRDETGVVFIDEAHNLEPDVLKMLPKLARFDTLEDGRVVGLQFVLIGNDDMREIMADTEYEEVRSKITVDHTLRFFSRAELKQFLKKRLAPIARMTDEPITEEGIEEMGRFTGGSPRLIGMICSHTMLFAAENPGRSIDAKMVQEAAEALMLSPVENAFAEEDNSPVSADAPFSEADMEDDAPAPPRAAAPPPFTDTQTIYSGDDDDNPDSSLRIEDAASAAGSAQVEADGSLYSTDHAAMATDDDDGDVVAGSGAHEDEDDDDSDFDQAAFEAELDEDDDFDEDFDDDIEDDETLTGGNRSKKKPAVRKGGAAFLARLGWRRPEAVSGPAKVLGASRKKEKPADAAPPRRTRRGPKTRIKGEREKTMKRAGIAAAVVGVLGLGFVAYKPVVSAVTGMASSAQQQIAGLMPSGGVEDAAQGPFDGMPTLGSDQSDGRDSVTVNVENTQSKSTGGWGARVVVSTENAVAAAVSKAPAVPGAVTGIAGGALDLVDRAIGAGERTVKGDKMGGVLAAAAGQVAGMRDRILKNGMTEEQAAARAVELVAKGDARFAQNKFITPSGANAYDAYREALSLQPGNEAAQAGITNLREHFATKAEGARTARQWEDANSYFETAIAISNLRSLN